MTCRYLWKKRRKTHDDVEIMMRISDTSRAQSTPGTLSRNTSGSGRVSGTRSWTMANDVVVSNQLTKTNAKAAKGAAREANQQTDR